MELDGARTPGERCEVQPGIAALPHGLLWIAATRSVVAADAHLAYEEAIGGALPLWSTQETLALLLDAVDRNGAREVVLLGDALHSSRMSEGAAAVVVRALDTLRGRCAVTPIAGNHEGRSRGRRILGATAESIERDGWLLLHGDDAAAARNRRCIVGHLHPSLPLAGGETVPVFLSAPELIVVPALTPYSTGLNVLSDDCTTALHAFVSSTNRIAVTAATADRVFPFGSLGSLRAALAGKPALRAGARRL
jgi:uncharacterized protein